MTGSVVPAYKAALFTLAQSLYSAPIKVVYGHPGTNIPNDVVGIRNATGEQAWAAFGAQRRGEQIDQDIVFSCWRGGVNQQQVTEIAFALIDTFDAALRKPAGDPTLGGLVGDCGITALTLTESEPGIVDGDGNDLMDKGRWAEVVVTVTAKNIRI